LKLLVVDKRKNIDFAVRSLTTHLPRSVYPTLVCCDFDTGRTTSFTSTPRSP